MERKMNLEEFAECVRYGVKAGLPYELEKAEVRVVYGEHWHAQIELVRPWTSVTPCFVITFDYREYLQGKRTPETVIAEILNSWMLYRMPLDLNNLDVSHFDSVKGRIVSRVISSAPHNRAYLKGRPAKYCDTVNAAVIWELHVYDLCEEDDTSVSVPVTWELLKAWGISVEELEQIAKENTPRLRPLEIEDMSRFLKDMGSLCKDFSMGVMLIVTNTEKKDGAIAAAYPGVRERLMEILQDDVYILPSSIHECIAVAKGSHNPADLYKIVCEVNDDQIAVEDFLANDVLEYTADGGLASVMYRLVKEKGAVDNLVDENRVFE